MNGVRSGIIIAVILCMGGLAYGVNDAMSERDTAPVLRDCGINPTTGEWK